MKKTMILFLLVFTVVSCKKTWQCECRQVSNWEDWNPVVTNIAIEDEREDDAKTICRSLDYDLGQGNYKTCSIK